jgi:hypothetical protein
MLKEEILDHIYKEIDEMNEQTNENIEKTLKLLGY